jgi:hypothetical protein
MLAPIHSLVEGHSDTIPESSWGNLSGNLQHFTPQDENRACSGKMLDF